MSKSKTALFITPPSLGLVGKKTKKFHRRFPPLDHLIAAQGLRDLGWTVKVLDLNADPELTESRAIELSKSADLVVLTTNPYADWQCPSFSIKEILEFASRLPGDKLIITGNHGSHYPTDMMERTGARIVARFEPEMSILEIAQGKSLNDVLGISFKDENGSIHHNGKRTLTALVDLPKPAYDLIDLKNYYYELLGGNFALLESSRGCPFSCNFCNLSMFQNKYRKSPPEPILTQIEDLVENKGCKSLYIFDLEFTINRPMVVAVSEFLISKKYHEKFGFVWACQTRADSVDPEMLALMKKSGCALIHFGVEAGNPEILKNTNKRITRETITEGLRATRTAGISSAAFFIFGHPGETEKHFRETLEFSLDVNPTYASFHPLLPFPGSPLFEKKFGQGPYLDQKMNLEMTYFSKEEEKQLGRFVRKAYLSFYVRPKYIWDLIVRGNPTMWMKQFRLFMSFLRA